MSEEKKESIGSMMDSLFGFAEDVVGRAEDILVPITHDWEYEEVIDDGKSVWVVTNGARKFDAMNRGDAEWLCRALRGKE